MWLFAPGSVPPARLLETLICRCLLVVTIACALGRLIRLWQVGFTEHRTNQCHHPNSKVQTFPSAEHNKTCYLSPWLSLWLISPWLSWFSASCPSFPSQFSPWVRFPTMAFWVLELSPEKQWKEVRKRKAYCQIPSIQKSRNQRTCPIPLILLDFIHISSINMLHRRCPE